MKRRDALALTVLGVCVLAMFWPILWGGKVFFYRDVQNYTYPCVKLIHDGLQRGELPYWNKWMNYGQPLMASPILLFWYPTTALHLILPMNLAYHLFYVLHWIIGGAGVYLLTRRWGASRLASFLASFLFTFSGPVLSLGNLYNHIAAAAWIPWALLATKERKWLLLCFVFSAQFLAAEPLTFLATAILCFACALMESKERARVLLRFGAVGLAIGGLCAVQILPSLSLLGHSARLSGLAYSEAANWSLHPLDLLSSLVPYPFGNVKFEPTEWMGMMGDGRYPYLRCVYIGIVPVFLAVFGAKRAKFAAAALGALLLLAFGYHTPIFASFYYFLPVVRAFRYPVKLFIPAVMMLAILAGFGFDEIRSQWGDMTSEHRRRVFTAAGVLLVACTAVDGVSFNAPWFNLLSFGLGLSLLALGLNGILVYPLAFLACLQLFYVGRAVNPVVSSKFYDYRSPVLQQFSGTDFRIYSPPSGAYQVRDNPPFNEVPNYSNTGVERIGWESLRERQLLANAAALNGVESGINFDLEHAFPSFLSEFQQYMASNDSDTERVNCLLGRSNVKYLVSRNARTSDSAVYISRIPTSLFNPAYLYEDRCFVPRAYLAGWAGVSKDSFDTLNMLSDANYEMRNRVIVNEPAPEPRNDNPGELLQLRDDAFIVYAFKPCYLVLNERYDTNWHAYDLNERELKIYRANQLFRAIYFPVGAHWVEFRYRQSGLGVGAIISVVTATILLAFYLRSKR